MLHIIDLCRDNGIEKINLDIMYGLEGLTKEDLRNCIDIIRQLKPDQVTLYEMRTNILGISEYHTKDELFSQYEFLYNLLCEMNYYGNFGQNTFSFNKNDFGLSSYLRHRVFDNMPYKGFGIAAQSKDENGVAYNIGKNHETLHFCMEKDSFIYGDIYNLPGNELLAKYLAISGYAGQFNIHIMNNIMKIDVMDYFKNEFKYLIDNEMVKINTVTGCVRITRNGYKYYGAVLGMFYPDVSGHTRQNSA
jgi:oxygen-independent coproporphyrinogen-3 oxidase